MSISNNPPADAAFSLEIDNLFQMLSDSLAGGAITSDEQEAALDALAKDFLKAKQDSDKARAAEKAPFDTGAKEVQTRWKPIVDKAARGQAECLAAITPYRQEKQRLKDVAAREAREAAEAQQKAAQEALRASDDLDAKYEAEQQLEAAQKLAAKANKIDRAPTGLRTWYEAEITDRGAALRGYIKLFPERFEALIQDCADHDARNGRPQRDGITYHEKKAAR